MPGGLGHYYRGILLRPSRTFAELQADPLRLRLGSQALALNAFLYTCVYVFLVIGGGAPSRFKPWLAIPIQDYYSWNRFLLLPSMVACWLLSAAVAHLLSRLAGGKGTYEDTLAGFGFAISIASLASLAHDFPDTLLGAAGVLDLAAYEVALNSPTPWRTLLWICYGASLLLFLWLFPKAVRGSQGIGAWPAACIGVFSFAVYQVMFLVFNR